MIQQHTKAFDDNVFAHADIDLAHAEQYQRTIRDARIGPHSFEYHFTLVSCRSTRRPEDEYRLIHGRKSYDTLENTEKISPDYSETDFKAIDQCLHAAQAAPGSDVG